eukprot:TRINITY_DN8673_c0_g1_i2.p1 TRINITY_DN8673_c0_g1~~TRINITY_DN8673_c0_g1_i2.p1  ORF type:complete len:293 (+),score=55.75 TRINITY_DN8673_c0_g1_i2:313-1191(+)
MSGTEHWEKTLRNDDMPATSRRLSNARSAVVQRLQYPSFKEQAFESDVMKQREQGVAKEHMLAGMEAIKEAVSDLTAFVFDELEATACHIQHQAAQIKSIQHRLVAIEVPAVESVKLSQKAASMSTKMKSVLTSMIEESNKVAGRVAALEASQKKNLEMCYKSLAGSKALLGQVQRSSSLVEDLRDEQLVHSNAALDERIRRLRECETQNVERTGNVDLKLADITAVAARSQSEVEELRSVLEYRLLGVESFVADVSTKLETLSKDGDDSRSRTRKAIQSLADVLQVASPTV